MRPSPHHSASQGGKSHILLPSPRACAAAQPSPMAPIVGVPRDAGSSSAAPPCARHDLHPGALCASQRVCMGNFLSLARCACKGGGGEGRCRCWRPLATHRRPAPGRLRPCPAWRSPLPPPARAWVNVREVTREGLTPPPPWRLPCCHEMGGGGRPRGARVPEPSAAFSHQGGGGEGRPAIVHPTPPTRSRSGCVPYPWIRGMWT